MIVSAMLIGLVLLHSGSGRRAVRHVRRQRGARPPSGRPRLSATLDRITVVVALIFAFTTTGLAFLLD